jgi:hypothetical protein
VGTSAVTVGADAEAQGKFDVLSGDVAAAVGELKAKPGREVQVIERRRRSRRRRRGTISR